MRRHIYAKRLIMLVLILILAAGMAPPPAARAEESTQKVVRVGWFDSSFCYWDRFGRRCGIDYEYQHKIAAYTGWTFEYVEDSWSNLFQMLKDGEIDLLSDVSYKPEREAFMSFPDLPMGTESYYIYISADNRELSADKPASFNGKRIGVNESSIQEGFLRDWAERNGISIEVVPLAVEEDESMDMVMRGEIDGYASIYSFSSEQDVIPVCKVGASEYFYAVNKGRPDLLAELNMALAGIQDEDPLFNQRLNEERLYNTRTNAYLTPTQEDWLAEHHTIRVGYRDNFLPFCQADAQTGELTGALKDYLAHAANSLRNTSIRFEAIPYATTEAALAALKAGQVDCVFPAYLSSYDSDQMNVRLTNPAMKTEMNAIMRRSNDQGISRDSETAFAVAAGDPNIVTFIMDRYPASSWQTFGSEQACYAAVAAGDVDCMLVSNYRLPLWEDTLEENRLFSVPSGESIPLSFAVNQSERDLYLLLNKTVVMTKSEEMDSALASYMRSDQKVPFTRFLKDNWIIVIVGLTAVFAVIIFLLQQKLKAERRANEQQRLLEEAAEIAELKQTIASLLDNMPGINFTKDAGTGVYLACNQAFAEYAHKDSPEGVIGLTTAQIFDAKTAARIAEDDRMALSMDKPYIFFENVRDVAGDYRRLQTVKLKYTDALGRQCILGICQDMTDMVSVRRENATTKEDYEKARSTGIVFMHIAQTLARGYADLFYVNLDTEEFIEYRTDEDSGMLVEVQRGWHFFEECQLEVAKRVHPDDQAAVIKALDRKALVAALERNKVYVITYRLISEAGPTYVSMRISRMEDDERYIVLGVSDVDELMKQRQAAERYKEEQIAYARLNALTGEFICIYVVVPETGRYREFSATSGYEIFGQAKEGLDFFAATRESARTFSHPEDLNRFLSTFTKENVMAEIGRHGIFMLSYRIMVTGKPRYVQLKAAMVEEKEGPRLIVGINDIDAQVRQEEEYVRHLAQARIEANVDALTGVKNRHAYLMAEERLNVQIAEQRAPEFAIVILDVNDLKRINDTSGHNAGDRYLKDACKIICDIFKRSPVFRIGGDEFAVVAQGNDYACIDELVGCVNRQNAEALKNGGIVIACGMARYENEKHVAPVFERADQNMYENKSALKTDNG